MSGPRTAVHLAVLETIVLFSVWSNVPTLKHVHVKVGKRLPPLIMHVNCPCLPSITRYGCPSVNPFITARQSGSSFECVIFVDTSSVNVHFEY